MMPRRAEAAEAASVAGADFMAAAHEPLISEAADVFMAGAETGLPGDRIQATRSPVVLADPAIP
jgi:hypothetical protein